jgi:hypothetical protein
MGCETLTEAEFLAVARRAGAGHWSNAASRWAYHAAAIACVREVAPDGPEKVLELGTMGVSIVKGSHTMDFSEKWNGVPFTPTYAHDARRLPWPIADLAYDIFVALRVFHHLVPHQAACFREARRIAASIVLVVPDDYDVPGLRQTSAAVPEAEVLRWNGGVPPTRTIRFGDWRGQLHFWDRASLATTR